MSKRNSEKNLYPSASPEKPKGEEVGIAEYLEVLNNVKAIEYEHISGIAERLFFCLADFNDHDVLRGELRPVGDEKFDKFVGALNRLLMLVDNSDIGSVKQLNATIVEAFDKKAAALVNCISDGDERYAIGGRPLLELLCDVVNEEILARRPDEHVNIRSASPAFVIDHSNRQNPIAT